MTALATPGKATQSEAYAALIRQGATPQVAQILAAVSRPESSGYTYATNNYQGNQYLGLWQIGSFHGFDNARLRSDDIDYQAMAALKVYQEQGFGAWQTYTNKSYLQYMDQTNTALALAHTNSLTAIAASVGAAAGQGASEGAQQAVGQPIALLSNTPSPLDSPGVNANPTSSPDTTPTAIDSPGSLTMAQLPSPLDSPGQNTPSGNPIDDPLGFDATLNRNLAQQGE